MSVPFGRPDSLIQRLPDEIVVELLEWTIGDELPSQRHALICQRWTRLLLETGTFWRKVKAEFISHRRVQSCASRLQRILELSKAALLDVTLDASGSTSPHIYSSRLFEILGTVDVQRWRSLVLRNQRWGDPPSNCMAGFFSGTFMALRYLRWERGGGGSDPYQPIYDLLILSPPTARTIHTLRALPAVLRNAAALRKVTDLTTPAQFYTELYQGMEIERVHLTNSHDVDFSLLSPLPKGVKFDVISSNSLAVLNLDTVQSMEILHYVLGATCRIELPSLVSLILPKNILHISTFAAPSLLSLRLGHDNLWGLVRQTESQNVTKLFTDNHDLISMAPTSLDMYLSITATATIAVLSYWAQIQQLSLDLTFGERFSWQGEFSTALIIGPDVMCPNLVTLKLLTRWDDDESNEWYGTARVMFKARYSGALRTIFWTLIVDKREQLMVLRREDIEEDMESVL